MRRAAIDGEPGIYLSVQGQLGGAQARLVGQLTPGAGSLIPSLGRAENAAERRLDEAAMESGTD